MNRQKDDALIPPPKKKSQTAKMEKSNIGLAHVNDISEGLVYNTVCARRMLCQLMPKIKTARMEACQQILSCYQSEVTDFLYCTVIGDNSWVQHYNLELKSQSLHHPTSPRKKKIQASALCWKMHHSFLVLKSIIHQEHMVEGTTINS